jgi:Ca2+-binding RTX toxin-like protein
MEDDMPLRFSTPHALTHVESDLGNLVFALHTSGTSGDDTINGTVWNDTIYGGNGNDVLHGGDGNDIVNGGNGDDQLFGDAGNDTLIGGVGNDVLFGGDGNDLLMGDESWGGGHGNDIIRGGNGDDTILGMGGDDTLFGDAGNDVINGGAGNDRIDGGAGRDILTGGSGADVFTFGIGDSPVGTATSDHITDFSSPYEFGGQGDLIATTDYVLSHRIGSMEGSYGSIEAAAAVASQFHPPGGPPLGSFLMIDHATGDAYLLMDQDGNQTFETGVIIDHGASMRIGTLPGSFVFENNDEGTPVLFSFQPVQSRDYVWDHPVA